MYRPKNYKDETEQKIETKPSLTEAYSYQSPYTTTTVYNKNNDNKHTKLTKEEITPKSFNINNNNTQNQPILKTSAPVFEAPPPPPPPSLVEAKINVPAKISPPKEIEIKPEIRTEVTGQALKKDVTYDMDYEKEAAKPIKSDDEKNKDITHDMDYQPDADDIDYDEDDIYDDDGEQDDDSEDLDDDDLLDDDDDDLEEADDEEVSDVDDTELMNRLEAKYGKLPAKEYESDEDPDDPTWTRNY
ncbi:uncharacterized protein ACRADG_012098 [Cochliomyia hominivorax]